MSEITITMSLVTINNGVSIPEYVEVIALLNDTMIRIAKDTGPQNSTRQLLDSIKNEKPKATFRIEWKPEDKYKNIFNALINKPKPKFDLFLRIYDKENGKIQWKFSAKATKANVKNNQKSGNASNWFHTIDIECNEFDYEPN